MDWLLGLLEASWVAQTLRGSRWGYAAISAGHVAGIALLIGAIVPLDLRLLGGWRSVPIEMLARVLVPVAAVGLALAVTTGGLLFSVRAREYWALDVVRIKVALVAVAAIAALALNRGFGVGSGGATRTRLAVHAILSLACWTAVLGLGRLIAFVG